MNKFTVKLLLSFLVLIGSTVVSAKPITEIDSYGIYVATKNGYVKIKPYSHDYRFVDFKYLNEIPFVERNDDKLTLIVYEKDFYQNSMELKLRPLGIKVKLEAIKFSVKPLGKPDMYEVSIDSPINNGAVLQVYSWGIFDNFGAITLGEPQAEFIKYFSQKELSNAVVITQYLDDALVAFPNNTTLKELSPYWKGAALKQKDKEAYAYVEEKWQQYEAAEKLTLKRRYLEALVVEINGYISQYPEGLKVKEAQERKSIAQKKLKEYEKLL